MSKTNPHNVKVGNKLWTWVFTIEKGKQPKSFEVTKVGSKFAVVKRKKDTIKVRLTTLCKFRELGEMVNPERYFVSKEALIENQRWSDAVNCLRISTNTFALSHLSSDEIFMILDVLKGKRPFSDFREGPLKVEPST